jgi:hypothetical protein
MAIAFDAAATGKAAAASSLTYAHTCTGSNLVLFVACALSGNPAGGTITGVTYNGVAMTSIASPIVIQSNVRTYLFYLIAPSTGANNIVISASQSGTIYGASSSYSGAKQTGVPDSSSTTGPVTTATITGTTTTVADNCWTVMCGFGNSAVGASTGSTSRGIATDGTQGIFDSNGLITPAGSHSMTVTNGSSDNGAVIIASFAPAVAAAATYRRRSLLGVGQ